MIWKKISSNYIKDINSLPPKHVYIRYGSKCVKPPATYIYVTNFQNQRWHMFCSSMCTLVHPCISLVVMVTQWWWHRSQWVIFQVCRTLRSHTVTGIKQVVKRSIFSEFLGLWGTFSNIIAGVNELISLQYCSISSFGGGQARWSSR